MATKLINFLTKILKKDVATLTGMAILTACGSSGTTAPASSGSSAGSTGASTGSGSPASTGAPSVPAPEPFSFPTGAVKRLGVNLPPVIYYSGDRSFANLIIGSLWLQIDKSGWPALEVERLNLNGYPKSLAAGERAAIVLTPPKAVLSSVGTQVKCTYEGTADVSVGGNVGSWSRGDHTVEFFWPAGKGSDARAWLTVATMNNADPVRNLDCREPEMSKTETFDPAYIASLAPFKVLRYLDMTSINGNPPKVTWATRTQPSPAIPVGVDGVAIEDLVAIANKAGADGWFNIPWNADEEYVTKMAQTIHDKIGPKQRVYVEVSNEVWNYQFGVASQSEREGKAAGLSEDRFIANMYRLGEKTTWAMKIWTKVFEDHPGQLVRVLSTPHDNTWVPEIILDREDNSKWVDAIATAPYFGYGLLENAGTTDLNALFPQIVTSQQYVINTLAKKYIDFTKARGKRFIAYEAGQHMISPGNVGLLESINRDPRMYNVYKDYLKSWRETVGDTMVLYAQTGAISPYGAWGLREYVGQPLSETPKLRAVVDDAPNWNG